MARIFRLRLLAPTFDGFALPIRGVAWLGSEVQVLQRQREHTLRHARVHNQLASDAQYAGGIEWCAFDYNTHSNIGAGDRICYQGVTDIFREPKPAAGFYKSQCDRSEEIVLEPAFHWANSDESTTLRRLWCARPATI